jgi:hypothetical protein
MYDTRAWVGSSEQVLLGEAHVEFDELLPEVPRPFAHPPMLFLAKDWDSFVVRATRSCSVHPVLRLLSTLPAVFVPRSSLESISSWIAARSSHGLVAGAVEDLDAANEAMIASNASDGINTDPVVRWILFACAPSHIEKPVVLWFAPRAAAPN